jgi:hypothetical protein
MKVTSETQLETTVAARIAGEDIACGQFVTVINEIIELPSYLWSCSSLAIAPDEPIRLRYMPGNAGQPCKVIGVCLPFVYVKKHSGSVTAIDTRQRQLVRLDYDCARAVWKRMRSSSSKKRK